MDVPSDRCRSSRANMFQIWSEKASGIFLAGTPGVSVATPARHGEHNTWHSMLFHHDAGRLCVHQWKCLFDPSKRAHGDSGRSGGSEGGHHEWRRFLCHRHHTAHFTLRAVAPAGFSQDRSCISLHSSTRHHETATHSASTAHTDCARTSGARGPGLGGCTCARARESTICARHRDCQHYLEAPHRRHETRTTTAAKSIVCTAPFDCETAFYAIAQSASAPERQCHARPDIDGEEATISAAAISSLGDKHFTRLDPSRMCRRMCKTRVLMLAIHGREDVGHSRASAMALGNWNAFAVWQAIDPGPSCTCC